MFKSIIEKLKSLWEGKKPVIKIAIFLAVESYRPKLEKLIQDQKDKVSPEELAGKIIDSIKAKIEEQL